MPLRFGDGQVLRYVSYRDFINGQKPYENEGKYQMGEATYYTERILSLLCCTQITEDRFHFVSEIIMR